VCLCLRVRLVAPLCGLPACCQVSSKYSKGRQLIAKKNRDIQLLLRKLDAVPTRAELMQYERRFVELNDQMAANLEETRKYFAKCVVTPPVVPPPLRASSSACVLLPPPLLLVLPRRRASRGWWRTRYLARVTLVMDRACRCGCNSWAIED
jgi:hypothetical protein